MELTVTQAVEVLRTPQNKKQIESVKEMESQLRVFTEELSLDELCQEPYWDQLKLKIKTRSAKKYERVLEFFRYPLPVAQISDSILSDFFKVFDGKNRNFEIDADRDVSKLEKWITDIDLEGWIEEQARTVFKNKPCSFVVVDKDATGTPYLILIDTTRLIDAKFKNPNGALEYIAFLHSHVDGVKRFSVYDSVKYYVFAKNDNSDEYVKEVDQAHNLGYCPAVTFISEPANNKNYFKRRVAFSKALSKYEDWTLFDGYRNYLDHYAPFPVTEGPENKCPNEMCKQGWIMEETINPNPNIAPVMKYYRCPICESKAGDYMMPGTHIGINVKADKNQNDGSGIFKMTFPDTEALKYVPEKLDDLELEIRYKTNGVNYMTSTNEAMNELQTKGSFASMESVLLRTKKELDTVYRWIVETAGKLMYKDLNLKVNANFGTEFYLVTEDDLQARFDKGKKMGLPIEELLMIYIQIIETKYKGNPNKVERQKLLLQLDPLPIYSVTEVIQLREKNLVDDKTLILKINFLNFVARFESETAPITQFGLTLEPQKRIDAIRAEFNRYVEAMGTITIKEPAQPGQQQ